MNLMIKSIERNNYKEIVDLKVSNEQKSYIETVEECLQEAKGDLIWRPVGIYDGEKPVGFAMYGLFLDEGENGRVWLDRFLISSKDQGKGYGKAAAKLLINHLYEEYGHSKIYLSVYENNNSAINLYKNLGFEFNGEIDINGEKVMVINLKVRII